MLLAQPVSAQANSGCTGICRCRYSCLRVQRQRSAPVAVTGGLPLAAAAAMRLPPLGAMPPLGSRGHAVLTARSGTVAHSATYRHRRL